MAASPTKTESMSSPSYFVFEPGDHESWGSIPIQKYIARQDPYRASFPRLPDQPCFADTVTSSPTEETFTLGRVCDATLTRISNPEKKALPFNETSKWWRLYTLVNGYFSEVMPDVDIAWRAYDVDLELIEGNDDGSTEDTEGCIMLVETENENAYGWIHAAKELHELIHHDFSRPQKIEICNPLLSKKFTLAPLVKNLNTYGGRWRTYHKLQPDIDRFVADRIGDATFRTTLALSKQQNTSLPALVIAIQSDTKCDWYRFEAEMEQALQKWRFDIRTKLIVL